MNFWDVLGRCEALSNHSHSIVNGEKNPNKIMGLKRLISSQTVNGTVIFLGNRRIASNLGISTPTAQSVVVSRRL